jgi:hypothetical protein
VSAPFVRIVLSDGKSYPLASVSGSPLNAGTEATPIGAARKSEAAFPNGEAGAPNLSNPSPGAQLANTMRVNSAGVVFAHGTAAPAFPCRECGGEGEAQYLALDETEYRWAECHECGGSGKEAPYCGVCEGRLTCDLYCTECDEWASLTYVERISPTRVAL